MKRIQFDPENDVYLETVSNRRKQEQKSVSSIREKRHYYDSNSSRGRFNAFMHQEIEPIGFGLIPEGYEWITYFALFLFLPKLTGMVFFFFYISHASFELYAGAHMGGFLFDWLAGYEILATLALLIIGKKLFSYIFAE